MASGVPQTRASTGRGLVNRLALVVGVVFLVVGVAGFIPGLTTNYDQLMLAGHDSGALLIGVFQVSVLHNVVHLLFGVVGVLAARARRSAFLYLVAGGVVYLVLWIYGVVTAEESGLNFVPLNSADDWLHLGLGLGMILLGLVGVRRPGVTPPRTSEVA